MKTRAKHSSPKAGFTLVEIMVSMVILILVLAGALALYLTYLNSWVITSLVRDTTSEASMALERMVYGVGTNSGLRAAQAGTVSMSYPSGGWRIDYSTNRFLAYNPGARTIADESGTLLAENVVQSMATQTNQGFWVSLSVSERRGGRTTTNAMSSFVEFRN